MFLALLMAAHIAGMILWFGGAGGAAAALLLAQHKRNFDKDLDALAWGLIRWGGLSGMFITCFSGAALAALNVQYFSTQDWFRLKLTLVLSAGAATGLLYWDARPQDDPPKFARIAKTALVLAVCAMAMLLLSTVRPF